MDLRQLRYFVGIVQAGSLSRAADQLHVAQSAVSHHLNALESELNRQLLTRGPKGVVLTEAGNILYRHAETILRSVEIAKQQTSSAFDAPSGRVSIGFPVAWANIVGYELFARIRNTYPHILLHITDGNSALVRERLINGRIDMAVLFTDHPERGLEVEPLFLEELFYVTRDPDPSPIRIADVARLPLLVPGQGSGSQRVADDVFGKHGLGVTPIGEIDSLSTLRNAIASGIGNAILPWCALYDDNRTIALNHRRIADVDLARPVALCFSEVGRRSPAIEAVALTLKSLVRELIESGKWQGVSLIADAAQGSAQVSTALAPP
jgi:DNA-binding transcriptional LysR family regulator